MIPNPLYPSLYIDPFNFKPQQGWQCPICKNVYSPSMVMCIRCHQDINHLDGLTVDIKITEKSPNALDEGRTKDNTWYEVRPYIPTNSNENDADIYIVTKLDDKIIEQEK